MHIYVCIYLYIYIYIERETEREREREREKLIPVDNVSANVPWKGPRLNKVFYKVSSTGTCDATNTLFRMSGSSFDSSPAGYTH